MGGFEFGGWDVAAVLVEAAVVEPVDPLCGGEFDLVDVLPWTAGLAQFGLVEPVDRLGQGVVVGVTDRPDGGGYLDFREPFPVLDRRVLGGFNRPSQHCLNYSGRVNYREPR